MRVTRQYHSTALLLPDGRVLSSGGGICGTCDQVGYLARNAEVFTPPYLFSKDGSGSLAPRPVIDSAPSVAGYGAAVQIATQQAASIRKVALVRLGAVTHSVNMEQRYVPLAFTSGSGSITATGPRDANIAPPGVYMLFVIDDAGVPSVARMISVGTVAPPSNSPPTVSLTEPANGATFAAPATVSIAASASDGDGSVTKVEFFNGSTKLGEDTTAPYAYTWSGVSAGSYSLTARATDNAGATATSAARTITVTGSSGANVPPTTAITSPTQGATFPSPSNITISATASDPDGTVQKVEFFRANGTVKLGEDTTAPYSYVWSNVWAGDYWLRVKATDDAGAVTTSASVQIAVR